MPLTIDEFQSLCTNDNFKKKSFNLLTDIVQEQVDIFGVDNLNSDKAIEKASEKISPWNNTEFSFLLLHSCYIPDHYPETGSEETLFSKLVEYLIYEWGSRLGYESFLQKEKSTKEDVTLINGNEVVVCDAKSNRLGRSQKSPNVKDVMKTSEYKTWLHHYKNKEQVGGFATFPSLMEWSKGSTIHTYLTDKDNPIMLIYNEHLSYMLLKKSKNPNLLFETLKNYSDFFPKVIKDKGDAKRKYTQMITSQLKSLEDDNDFSRFIDLAHSITAEYVRFSIERLEKIIEANIKHAKSELSKLDPDRVKEEYIKLKSGSLNNELKRLLDNIRRFRV